MSIIAILVAIVVLVFCCWLVATYMPAPFKTPVLVVVVLIAVIWLLSLLFPALTAVRVG